MNTSKQPLCILALSLLLIAVASLPLILTGFQNHQLMNDLHIDDLPIESVENNQMLSKKYNTLQRLNIIKNSVSIVATNGGVLKYQNTAENAQSNHLDLIRTMEKELTTMQNENILPHFDFPDDCRHASFVKKTFIDSNNPDVSVSIWDISAEYKDFSVKVYMDTETSMLYEVSISTTNDEIFAYEPFFTFESFDHYLQIGNTETKDIPKVFFTHAMYETSQITLSIFCIDQNDSVNTLITYSEYSGETAVSYDMLRPLFLPSLHIAVFP